jgi:hypothetical protein
MWGDRGAWSDATLSIRPVSNADARRWVEAAMAMRRRGRAWRRLTRVFAIASVAAAGAAIDAAHRLIALLVAAAVATGHAQRSRSAAAYP